MVLFWFVSFIRTLFCVWLFVVMVLEIEIYSCDDFCRLRFLAYVFFNVYVGLHVMYKVGIWVNQQMYNVVSRWLRMKKWLPVQWWNMLNILNCFMMLGWLSPIWIWRARYRSSWPVLTPLVNHNVFLSIKI